MSFFCAALITTYGRPVELHRLLDSICTSDLPVQLVVVVDNGGSDETRAVVEASALPTEYIRPTANLGCGGGLRLAGQRALELGGRELTHILILDDDAVLSPDTVRRLRDAMQREDAVAAYPLAIGPDGNIGWTPGLKDRVLHDRTEPICAPDEYRARLGVDVAEFAWAQGICLLVRRDAVERVGLHRGDFWVRGEDLEYSLRLASCGRTVFIPGAEVFHYPPQSAGKLAGELEYLKHAAMLQNIAYVTWRLPHGRVQSWTLPGSLRRFLAEWGWSSLPDALQALWRGVVLGQPAGCGNGNTFLKRFRRLTAP